ncbi:hypothetical protein BCR43DRAFT_497629 [Syncephalastrum racemosum]|uniref:Uncharacterized protein n=1 Tax=Syncephalastrum racemosum TaxID=13706 RepID=A0A1X2H2J9_SYNRA|nr:hypothetical protein BCR43DRAFT_497629 [Syncephalastrum racemosum]
MFRHSSIAYFYSLDRNSVHNLYDRHKCNVEDDSMINSFIDSYERSNPVASFLNSHFLVQLKKASPWILLG